MTRMSIEDLERHLESLPREAWDRPTPPPPPWPADEARPRASRWRSPRLMLRPVVAAAASLVLVGAGIGVGALLTGGDEADAPGGPGAAPLRVQLEPVGGRGEGASGVARVEPQPGGRATLELAGLRPSGDDDFYELWLLGEDGRLVSLGPVRVPDSGEATVDVELPVDPGRFDYIDVSREPADGDPLHSTISVLRGPVES